MWTWISEQVGKPRGDTSIDANGMFTKSAWVEEGWEGKVGWDGGAEAAGWMVS